MKYTQLEVKNLKLKQEFSNEVYDTVGEAINATMKKHKYKKYDVFKLVSSIYAGDYGYITGKNDYRVQVKLLDEYFRKEYKFSIIVFEMIKTIKSFQDTDKYNELVLDIAAIETIIRTGKEEKPKNPGIFSDFIKQENYAGLMDKIEKESSFRYAIMIVYDKLKFKKNK